MDKALTAEQIAHEYGYKASFVREACNRDSKHHPLPHIRRGNTRPVAYIRKSTFETWLDEEEKLTVGLEEPEEEIVYSIPGMDEVMEKLEAMMNCIQVSE